jgi:dTDP-4-amino-4,6-dideoxygalactose transaminase
MTLALDGGTPVRTAPWPGWPPAASQRQRELLMEVADSGRWGATPGGMVDVFAERFAARMGARHGVCVANATVALFAALRTLGVEEGDEVIVPAYTFIASATAVVLAGARPVLADVTPQTLHIDPAAVESLIGPRTKAVMPVHLAGAPADMDALTAVVAPHGIPLLEDAAQAHGATWHDRPVGALGDAACFSFQSSKAMTAGEGGIIVTNDDAVYERAWSIANLGRRRDGDWYQHFSLGWNLRMTEFQAAMLLPQLDTLDDEISAREGAAEYLAQELPEGLDLLPGPAGTTRHTWHLAVVRYDNEAFGGRTKREFIAAMSAEGIPLNAGYPALSRAQALQPYVSAQSCRVAEAAEASIVWMHQSLLMAEKDALTDIVTAATKVQRAFAG